MSRDALRFAVLGNAVPIMVVTASHFSSHDAAFFAAAAGACVAPVVVNAMGRRHRLSFYLAAYGGILAFTMLSLGLVTQGYFIALALGTPLGFCLGLSKTFTNVTSSAWLVTCSGMRESTRFAASRRRDGSSPK